jgi:hypothetical protein
VVLTTHTSLLVAGSKWKVWLERTRGRTADGLIRSACESLCPPLRERDKCARQSLSGFPAFTAHCSDQSGRLCRLAKGRTRPRKAREKEHSAVEVEDAIYRGRSRTWHVLASNRSLLAVQVLKYVEKIAIMLVDLIGNALHSTKRGSHRDRRLHRVHAART